MNAATMKQQVIDEIDQLGEVIRAVAAGKHELMWVRDRLQDAVDIKIEILRGMEKETQEG